MSKTTINNCTGGLSLASILTIIFVISKITGYIAWSWLWVFSPLWLPVLAVLGAVFCIILASGAFSIWKEYSKSKRIKRKQSRFEQKGYKYGR